MGWDYFSRLSWAAKWYLPPAEAAEVLEDYRAIVNRITGADKKTNTASHRRYTFGWTSCFTAAQGVPKSRRSSSPLRPFTISR